MRRAVCVVLAGAFLPILAGCGDDTPPPAASGPEKQEPAPPPPPPKGADVPVPSSGQPPGPPVPAALPRLPGAVTEPPAWGDAAPPFDLAEFFKAPPPEQNAAPLYLDALAEFGTEMAEHLPPEERKRREPLTRARDKQYDRLEAAWRKDPASVSDAEVDAWLAGYETGFQKLAVAQQRPQSIFQSGYSPIALVPHLPAVRQVARVVEWRTRRDLARGDFERPTRGLGTVLRLSRDLRPRGPMVGQLVSVGVDNMCCQQIVPAILTAPGIKAEHCDRLLAVLIKHEADASSLFWEGYRAEYITARGIFHDLQHRTGMFDPRVLREEFGLHGPPGAASTCLVLLKQLDICNGPLARERWPDLFRRQNPTALIQAATEFDHQIAAMTAADYAQEAAALNRVYVSILALAQRTSLQQQRAMAQPALLDPLRETKLAVFLQPLPQAMQVFLRAEATLRGTKCLIALRRWQLEHTGLPKDLEVVVKAAGMPEVPIDPFSDQPLRMAVVQGEPVVYSVGKDGRDDKALADWDNGQKPGDFVFRLQPPSE